MGKPVLTFEKVYRACNKYHWFTGGSNEQYSKLFAKVDEGASLREVALIIWLCTPNETQPDIELTLGNFCLEEV